MKFYFSTTLFSPKQLLSFSLCLLCTFTLQAQVYWDGGAATDNWNDAANWSSNTVPAAGDNVILDHSLLSGSYKVVVPNSQVAVTSLHIYPSLPGDSILLEIPGTNNISDNLQVTGTGFHALAVGNRGRINNRHGGGVNIASIVIADVNNYGMLLDTGAYYYHATNTRDNNFIYNLNARFNSTFEYDMPSNNSLMVFPLNVAIDSLVFYNLKLSGYNGGAFAATYAVTLANDWNLIVNGDFTVDNAAFGLIRGDGTQLNRAIHFRGNVTAVNTTKTTWIDMIHGTTGPVTLGWNVVFDGHQPQNITGNINFLDRVTVNNSSGLRVNHTFSIAALSAGFFPNNPGLTLTQGVISTPGTGLIDFTLPDAGKLNGYAPGGSPSSASYISGRLRRTVSGTGTYDFPVGAGNSYQLLAFTPTSLTGTTKVTAAFFTTPLGSITTPLQEAGNSYQAMVNAGYWKLTPDIAPAGGTYSLHAYETGYTHGADNFTLVTRTDSTSAWTIQGTAGTDGISQGVIDASRSGFSSFYELGIATTRALPTDLAISYNNYAPGTVTNADTLFLDFTLKNNGPADLAAGDTLYFSARINGQYMGMNLSGTQTPYILPANLDAGDSVSINPGYLLPAMGMGFFPGAATLEICAVVWGKGFASVDLAGSSFPADTDPSNNSTCVLYDPLYGQADSLDLAISFDNYASGTFTDNDTLFLGFTVKNNGPDALLAGDTLYFSSRINNTYMGLNLIGTETPHILSADLNAGDSISINPGYLISATTLAFFPGAETLNVCVVVWGKGISSVDLAGSSFPADYNPANNTACITYDPDLYVSAETFADMPQVSVYPIPASSWLTFSFSQGGTYGISITNTLGQTVERIQTVQESQTQIDISGLRSGLYFYRITMGNKEIAAGKLIKQ